MKAQPLSAANRTAPPIPITQDPDKVNLDPGDVRKIPRAAIPVALETRGQLPPRRTEPPAADPSPDRRDVREPAPAPAASNRATESDLLPLDIQVLTVCAVAAPEPAVHSTTVAHAIDREPEPTRVILKSLRDRGLLEQSGHTRGLRWRTTPAGMLKVCGDLSGPERREAQGPDIKLTLDQVYSGRVAIERPLKISTPNQLQSGPLPRPREIPRGGGKKSRHRLLAGQITKREDWFVWEGGAKVQAAQVRRWAQEDKLPIDRYFDTAGRLIVCHKDAEVLR